MEPSTDPDGPNNQTVLLTVVYDSGIDGRIEDTLTELDVTGWTKTFRAQGTGGAGPRRDTPIWPGTVNILYLVLPSLDAHRVVTAVRELQSSYRLRPGVTMWVQPVTLC